MASIERYLEVVEGIAESISAGGIKAWSQLIVTVSLFGCLALDSLGLNQNSMSFKTLLTSFFDKAYLKQKKYTKKRAESQGNWDGLSEQWGLRLGSLAQ